MSKIAIITGIYDDYDTLKPTIDQSVEVEWICVTDTMINKENKGWKIVYEPRWHLHPNRAAKTPKCLPWLYTDCDASIWIDASYQVKSWVFAEDAMAHANPIAQFTHPWRNCAYAEAEESLKLPKYADERTNIERFVRTLRDRGHPDNWGLWATGVIARKHTVNVNDAGSDWLADLHNYSYQDQLSHPDNMRRYGIRPVSFPGTHLSNDWLSYEGSGRH